MTVDLAQMNRPARATAWTERVKPRTPCDKRGPDRRRPEHVPAGRKLITDGNLPNACRPCMKMCDSPRSPCCRIVEIAFEPGRCTSKWRRSDLRPRLAMPTWPPKVPPTVQSKAYLRFSCFLSFGPCYVSSSLDARPHRRDVGVRATLVRLSRNQRSQSCFNHSSFVAAFRFRQDFSARRLQFLHRKLLPRFDQGFSPWRGQYRSQAVF
jgi:hypothetical protein